MILSCASLEMEKRVESQHTRFTQVGKYIYIEKIWTGKTTNVTEKKFNIIFRQILVFHGRWLLTFNLLQIKQWSWWMKLISQYYGYKPCNAEPNNAGTSRKMGIKTGSEIDWKNKTAASHFKIQHQAPFLFF